MRFRVLDDVPQEARVGLWQIGRPGVSWSARGPCCLVAGAAAYSLLDSMPMAEYFKEQSSASLASNPATYSSVRKSWFGMASTRRAPGARRDVERRAPGEGAARALKMSVRAMRKGAAADTVEPGWSGSLRCVAPADSQTGPHQLRWEKALALSAAIPGCHEGSYVHRARARSRRDSFRADLVPRGEGSWSVGRREERVVYLPRYRRCLGIRFWLNQLLLKRALGAALAGLGAK